MLPLFFFGTIINILHIVSVLDNVDDDDDDGIRHW